VNEGLERFGYTMLVGGAPPEFRTDQPQVKNGMMQLRSFGPADPVRRLRAEATR
jgi:hypothetical protein